MVMDVHATVLWRTEMDWASQAGVGGRVQMPRMSALLTTDGLRPAWTGAGSEAGCEGDRRHGQSIRGRRRLLAAPQPNVRVSCVNGGCMIVRDASDVR